MPETMDDQPTADAPIFSAVLSPHRSLSRGGFHLLMALLVMGWIVSGVLYLAVGAWPVFLFFGLDVVAVFVAFTVNYRAARVREFVRVSRTELAIRKVAPSGRAEDHRFNPLWAKFRVARHPEIGVTNMAVVGEGRLVRLGAFLNPDDRESFATAFSAALADARR